MGAVAGTPPGSSTEMPGVTLGRGSATAVLICRCGRSLASPLMLGSGNDLDVELANGWYLAFEPRAIVECPECHRSIVGPAKVED